MRRRRLIVLLPPAATLVVAACGGLHGAPPPESVDASTDHAVADVAIDAVIEAAAPQEAGTDAAEDADAGPCDVRLDMPAIAASPHVPEGTPVTYTSNPPSSGPHYPIWANFQEFDKPIDDGYLVHSMEHGAVLLLYKCETDGGACTAMVNALRAVRDAVPTDALCDPSIRVRVILAPRPANDVPVAAAAWGNTYRAACVDAPSLAAFITAHYAQAPENFCAAGQTTF